MRPKDALEPVGDGVSIVYPAASFCHDGAAEKDAAVAVWGEGSARLEEDSIFAVAVGG